MRGILFSGLICLVFAAPSYAQSAEIDTKDSLSLHFRNMQEVVFHHGHIGASVRGFLTKGNKGQASGDYLLHTILSPGFAVTLDYVENFSPRLGLRFGVSYGALPMNTEFSVSIDNQTGVYTSQAFEDVPFLGFSLEGIYRQKIARNLIGNIRSGVAFRSILATQTGFRALAEDNSTILE
jgi:hypothetical protein